MVMIALFMIMIVIMLVGCFGVRVGLGIRGGRLVATADDEQAQGAQGQN
jgi:hypothetical protein